jgi:hypothetical protein
MRIERTSKSPSAPAPAAGVRARTAPAEGSQSFSNSANDAALAFQQERQTAAGGDGLPDDAKVALASIDDIAARYSLNIVERREPGTVDEQA